MSLVQYCATGRRKTATARVYLRPGSGTMIVNRRPFAAYFHHETMRRLAREPLTFTEMEGRFDVLVNVSGGGETGQAGAVRQGLARALVEFDTALRPRLREAGFLTRDSRVKERKKYGQRGARARFQFSKR